MTQRECEDIVVRNIEKIAKNGEYTEKYYSRNGEEVKKITMIETAVNSFSIDEKKFAEKIANTGKEGNEFISAVFLDYIIKTAEKYKKGMYDLRNEASSEKCRDIVTTIDIHVENYKNMKNYIEAVTEELTLMHRTLQQTFSKVIFNYILIQKDNKDMKKIADKFGEDLLNGIPMY